MVSNITEHPSYNPQNSSVVWLHTIANTFDDYVQVQQELHSIVNQFQIFESEEQCVDYIRHATIQRITLIVNGQTTEHFLRCIHSYKQLIAIYIYCFDTSSDENWTSEFKKIKAPVPTLDMLIGRIRQDQRSREKSEEPLSIINVTERSSMSINGNFLHLKLLIDILIKMTPADEEKNELATFCRSIYKDESTVLAKIQQFEQEYDKKMALWWYTLDSFVYRMLNKAFRTMDDDLLILFRFLIRDIRSLLNKEQTSSIPIRVYRGQLMSEEELRFLYSARSELISINSFFSATLNPDYARLLIHGRDLNGLKPVFFEIDADPCLSEAKTFANISSQSQFPEEEEVLFMCGSIFRVTDVREENETNVVHLTLSNTEDHDLKELFKQVRKEIDENNDLYTLARFLRGSGKLNTAEKCVHLHLKELGSDNPDASVCYDMLGQILHDREQYDESLRMFEKALQIAEQNNYFNTDTIYLNMGTTYQKMGNQEKALSLFHKALNMLKETHGNEHDKVAACYHNIGTLYYDQEDYQKAIDYYLKDLSINQKRLLPLHPDLATSHLNIGTAYAKLGRYDRALEQHDMALQIWRKSLPADHYNIGIGCQNIGIDHGGLENYSESLSFYKKAAAIFKKSLPSTHSLMINIELVIEKNSALLDTLKQ